MGNTGWRQVVTIAKNFTNLVIRPELKKIGSQTETDITIKLHKTHRQPSIWLVAVKNN